jgi:protein-L-isoaspartate(D-aspartate) O-methyltransferase
MAYIDFMSHIHKSTQRDYLARVNDTDFPKAKAARLCKDWGHDYWDGDRRICYGGYRYMQGRWAPVGQAMIDHYGIKPGDKILDIGCGKGFQLYELTQLQPGVDVYGVDISTYAIENAKEELKDRLQVANASNLPFPDNHFDFVFRDDPIKLDQFPAGT